MATYEESKYRAIPINAEQIADESISNTEFQHLNGVNGDIQTQIGNLDTSKLPKAGGTLTGNVTLADNVHLYAGAGQDIDILSDGTVGYIKANDLRLQSSTGENYVTAAVNGAANLWYDNANKLQTTASGIGVTGEVSATGNIVGNGQHLTNLNGSNISSGTVADARISTLTASKLTGALPAIDGSNLTGIDVVPSSGTAIGAIREFTIVTTQQSWVSASLSVGTTVTPSTVTFGQSYMVLADAYQGTSSRRYKQGSTPEQMIGTRTTITGTWRCISQLTASSSGSGQAFVGTSMPGLLQRIS